MKIAIVFGTRPEIIKCAPIIRECEKRKIDFFVIHSNQHYSKELSAIFLEELKLAPPRYNLGIGSGTHGVQLANMLLHIEPILIDEKPDVVLVQGDTNTALAGMLAASKLGIKVGHVEAGLRSYDRTMPEETNRIMIDHVSDFLFAVGLNQEHILKGEGIEDSKISIVGNTICDALDQHLELVRDSTILEELGLLSKEYFLVTAHRPSNVDSAESLREMFMLFEALHQKYSKSIVWPIHPRTSARLITYEIKVPSYLKIIPPSGYLDFIQLEKHALLILTDSGGIQEEACILGVPCITLRENTERPESIEVGANVLVGRNSEKAIQAADEWMRRENYDWENPFGDSRAAHYILDVIIRSNNSQTEITTNTETKETVSVIGMGFMGLPTACLLSKSGFYVTGVDIVEERVKCINNSQCPFAEEGLPELIEEVVSTGHLKATTEIPSSDYYIIAVPTPHKDQRCDTTYLFRALDSVSRVAKSQQTVIIESTISPRTCLSVSKYFKKQGLHLNVVHCPERATPGRTLHELVYNDRIIGALNPVSHQKVKSLYGSFVKGEIFLTDLTTAECIKLVENTSRDVGIAFANELSEICEELKVDVHEVIRLANKHPRVNILSPGAGVGGHCIPIDPWFLVEDTTGGELVRLSRNINDQRPFLIAEKVDKLAKLDNNNSGKIGILGVAFKPNVDDCRETPAIPIYQELRSMGYHIKYHDPFVDQWNCDRVECLGEMENWADVLVIVTGHDEYNILRNSPSKVLDPCGLLK